MKHSIFKKGLAALLVIVMVIGLLPVMAAAAGNIAEIDGVGYATFEAAFEAANAASGPVTIKALGNPVVNRAAQPPTIDQSELADINSPITVAAGKDITLDLNGFGIWARQNSITVNGTFTLTDSSTAGTGLYGVGDAHGVVVNNGGTLNVNSGRYYVTYYGLWDTDTVPFINNSGTVNISGGTIANPFGSGGWGSNTETAAYTGDGTFNITGGYFGVATKVVPATGCTLDIGEFGEVRVGTTNDAPVFKLTQHVIAPAAPAVVNVSTTEGLQAALDAAVKGTTIIIAAGNYGTVYLRNNGTDANRIMENVTVKAADDATVNIVQIASSTAAGKYLDIENLTIDGLTFSDPKMTGVWFDYNQDANKYGYLRVNGLTVQNCSKTGDQSKSGTGGGYNYCNFGGFFFDGENPGTKFAGDPTLDAGYHNIKILNNQIEKVYIPIYFCCNGPKSNLTVTGNTFDNCLDNHIGISGTYISGTNVITNNAIVDMTGRFARIAGATADATFTFSGNTVTMPKGYDTGGDGDIVKITGNAGFTVTDTNNGWTVGSYRNDAKTTWIADGDTALLAKNVAKIGTTEYVTLQEAFNAAQDGDTITLMADAAAVQAEFKRPGITATLDLNGYVISGVAYNAGNGSYTVEIPIKVSSGTLVIDDSKGGGKIIAKEDTTYGGNYCLYLFNGNAVIKNGILESSKCAVLELGNSLLTIDGGKIIANGTDVQYVQAINNMSASLVINGGEFESNGKALFAQNDKAEVKGGFFKGAVDCKTYKPLKGGYYTSDVTAYVAEGYKCIDNPDSNKADYPFKVTPDAPDPVVVEEPTEEKVTELVNGVEESKQEEAKTEINTVVDNTTPTEAQKAATQEALTAAVNVADDSVVEALKTNLKEQTNVPEEQKAIDEALAAELAKQIKIDLTAIAFTTEQTEGMKVSSNTVKYDVKPIVTYTVGSKTITAQIPNSMIKEKIPFRLGVSAAGEGKLATVKHKGEFFATVPVMKDDKGCYVELENDEFSEYEVTFTESDIQWTCEQDSGIYGTQGIVRFLFDTEIADQYVSLSKVVFVKFDQAFTTEAYQEGTNAVSVSNSGSGAFYGDVKGLAPDNSYNICAYGYVKLANGVESWSAQQTWDGGFAKPDLTDYNNQ